jgi:hypothetical protein
VKEIEQDIKKGLSWVRKTENVDQHLRSYLWEPPPLPSHQINSNF